MRRPRPRRGHRSAPSIDRKVRVDHRVRAADRSVLGASPPSATRRIVVDVQLTETDAPESVDEVAASVFGTLYAAVTGCWPLGLRAYQEDDTLLVLLRFDRTLLIDAGGR